MSETRTWTLPLLLREGVAVVPETGLYPSESEFVAEAIRTLLAARPDLRLAITCRLYERGAVSLGRAADLSGLNVEVMKEALHRRGVSRVAPEDREETEEMARAAMKAAGR